ncbi:MAG: hypothetical protein ACYTG2_02335 [Planctomycetota bacterium]|jgi:hypothetical protein
MTTRCARAQAGYVLVAVLLLGSLIVLTAGTFARHTMVSYHSSSASLWVQETREAADSGLAFARQLAASGVETYDGSIDAGDQQIALSIADAGSGLRTIRVDATRSGMGTTLQARAAVLGAVGEELPALESSAATAAKNDPAQVKLLGTQTLADTVIQGTLVLARGSRITLRDVVVKGTIVSEPALVGPPYAPLEATTLVLEGSVRIDGGLLLQGCAIVMPDGELTAASGSRVEAHGIVLAERISWFGSGSLDSHVVARHDVSLPSGVDRPGWGRTPPDWPDCMEMTAWTISSLAFPKAQPTGSEQLSIKGFAFTAGS